jgi:hypothetical protein
MSRLLRQRHAALGLPLPGASTSFEFEVSYRLTGAKFGRGSSERMTHYTENAVTEAAPDLCTDRRRPARSIPIRQSGTCVDAVILPEGRLRMRSLHMVYALVRQRNQTSYCRFPRIGPTVFCGSAPLCDLSVLRGSAVK